MSSSAEASSAERSSSLLMRSPLLAAVSSGPVTGTDTEVSLSSPVLPPLFADGRRRGRVRRSYLLPQLPYTHDSPYPPDSSDGSRPVVPRARAVPRTAGNGGSSPVGTIRTLRSLVRQGVDLLSRPVLGPAPRRSVLTATST